MSRKSRRRKSRRNKNKLRLVAAVADRPAVTGSPVPDSPGTAVTPYEQLAASVRKALTDLRAMVPDAERGRGMSPQFVRAHVNVPTASLKTVYNVVAATPSLQAVGKYRLQTNRDTLQFLDAFQPVMDDVVANLKEMKRIVDSRKAALVVESLQIYAIAQGIIRDPLETVLALHVENMRRDLRRKGGRKKKKTAPGPPPAPALAAAA
jgi:hypothetical protein